MIERSDVHDITLAEIYFAISPLAAEVEYYLIDFNERVPFWIEAVELKDFGFWGPYGVYDELSKSF